MSETLGELIRRRRGELGLGLRATAKKVGISATFLSRVETQDDVATPSEEVIRKLAVILDEDFDLLMSLAGRVPSDVKDVVRADPKMPEFLRRVGERRIPADQLLRMLDEGEDS